VRVLQYLIENESITRAEAAREIGAHELAVRIMELEAEGCNIRRTQEVGRNRYGDLTHFTRYTLVGAPANMLMKPLDYLEPS
jgi:hypothetical protein